MLLILFVLLFWTVCFAIAAAIATKRTGKMATGVLSGLWMGVVGCVTYTMLGIVPATFTIQQGQSGVHYIPGLSGLRQIHLLHPDQSTLQARFLAGNRRFSGKPESPALYSC
jgi:hypothetical protein